MTRRTFLFSMFLTSLIGWLVWPAHGQTLRLNQPAPDIAGGPWIHSPPLTLNGLKGRVVYVEFWTYG